MRSCRSLQDARINVLGAVSSWRTAGVTGGKVIYASSAAVYGDPVYLPVDEPPVVPQSLTEYQVYGGALPAGLSRLYGVRFTVLRYANVSVPARTPTVRAGWWPFLSDRLLKDKRVKSLATAGRPGISSTSGTWPAPTLRWSGVTARSSISVRGQPFGNRPVSASKGLTGSSWNRSTAPPGDILHSCLANERAGGAGVESPCTVEEGLRRTLVITTQPGSEGLQLKIITGCLHPVTLWLYYLHCFPCFLGTAASGPCPPGERAGSLFFRK